MSDKKEKKYTLKNIPTEIARLEKSKNKKKELIKKLTAEIKDENSKIKELESALDALYHENLQKQIAVVWFKEQKMTGEQINKFLELSKQIGNKIDNLNVSDMVNAVATVYNEHKPEENDTFVSAEENVDTKKE